MECWVRTMGNEGGVMVTGRRKRCGHPPWGSAACTQAVRPSAAMNEGGRVNGGWAAHGRSPPIGNGENHLSP